MPRAAEFRHAAQELRARSTACSDAATAHRRHHLGKFGGPIGEIHDESVGAIAARFDRAGGELRSLAELCDRRADVCDDYAAQVARWFQLPDVARLLTPFPPRPATWVDV